MHVLSLGPGMAAWQGPALCCYNDAVFSAADLRAISRIGQDSKLDKPEATGRCRASRTVQCLQF
jgi:sacsin